MLPGPELRPVPAPEPEPEPGLEPGPEPGPNGELLMLPVAPLLKLLVAVEAVVVLVVAVVAVVEGAVKLPLWFALVGVLAPVLAALPVPLAKPLPKPLVNPLLRPWLKVVLELKLEPTRLGLAMGGMGMERRGDETSGLLLDSDCLRRGRKEVAMAGSVCSAAQWGEGCRAPVRAEHARVGAGCVRAV